MEKIKPISPNPKKQLLACDQVITLDKNGKIQKTEWKYEILED
ncbi:MAG: hypothetical protein MRECE_2c105 [Mycoplasmataceae bacterium CE_OT135]|nr:MAG: hypothetical protein MRECE_2c105 [Mycoplasmataceae bacterium CE_OT135]